jgi:hypothetical protein
LVGSTAHPLTDLDVSNVPTTLANSLIVATYADSHQAGVLSGTDTKKVFDHAQKNKVCNLRVSGG